MVAAEESNLRDSCHKKRNTENTEINFQFFRVLMFSSAAL
jgi:hypothetical protein